jgi:hypothetical protein
MTCRPRVNLQFSDNETGKSGACCKSLLQRERQDGHCSASRAWRQDILFTHGSAAAPSKRWVGPGPRHLCELLTEKKPG